MFTNKFVPVLMAAVVLATAAQSPIASAVCTRRLSFPVKEVQGVKCVTATDEGDLYVGRIRGDSNNYLLTARYLRGTVEAFTQILDVNGTQVSDCFVFDQKKADGLSEGKECKAAFIGQAKTVSIFVD